MACPFLFFFFLEKLAGRVRRRQIATGSSVAGAANVGYVQPSNLHDVSFLSFPRKHDCASYVATPILYRKLNAAMNEKKTNKLFARRTARKSSPIRSYRLGTRVRGRVKSQFVFFFFFFDTIFRGTLFTVERRSYCAQLIFRFAWKISFDDRTASFACS